MAPSSRGHFGVDPATCEMDVCQYYSWLLQKFDGNRKRIKDFLKHLGHESGKPCFMQQCTLESNWDLLGEAKRGEYSKQLSDLSLEWARRGVTSEGHSPEAFAQDAQLRERFASSVVTLKYFELPGARFWKNRWAKEMRGTVLFVNPETAQVKVLAFKLPRGAEVMTGMHQSSGIGETQDVWGGKLDILDDEQIDTCTRLIEGQPIEVYLTSKGDGSLLAISSFTGEALKVMLPVVDVFGNDYARLWAAQSMKLSQGQRLLVAATQGTVFQCEHMEPYMVTSMLVGGGITERATLEHELETSHMSHVEAWAKYGEAFVAKLLRFTFFDDLSESLTFSFEAICRENRGLFGDGLHTELACAYARDRLVFLGVSLCDQRFYVPHPLYGKTYSVPFEEPLWWHVEHSNTITSMMEGVELMIFDKMSRSDFLTRFPPANAGFDPNDPAAVADAVIDFEGWVAMKTATGEITDPEHLRACDHLGIPLTIYSKIKTVAYYKAHKFHEENIPFLMALAPTAGHIFPMARKAANLLEPGAFGNRLRLALQKARTLLDFQGRCDHPLLASLRSDYLEAVALWESGEATKVPKDPLSGFFDRPMDMQCKMVVGKSKDFEAELVRTFGEVFPDMNLATKDLALALKRLILLLEPWQDDFDSRVAGIEMRSPAVQVLVKACLGLAIA